jgi:SAM-dependent methyltransferase
MTQNRDGYTTNIPYLRDFKPMLAPAWLDHVALVGGIEPPDRGGGFTWCDLGCGQGVTAAILAATHPNGEFFGVDAMAVHTDHGRRLASVATIPNTRFHAADFAAAIELGLPQFDYIVAHGVYSWVDRASQSALLRFIDRRLKPGGLVYLSYNALPGWVRDLPFQRLVQELDRIFPGDGTARFAAAAKIAGALADAGVPALADSFIVKELKERPEDYTPAYLVHEFMPAAWRPLWVTEVRTAMAPIGLEPVGSATLSENLDWMVLDEPARQILATIADAGAAELVRDFYLDQRLRCDVFARGNRRVSPGERPERLFASTFALARPLCEIRYRALTPAGALSYDSPAARAIIATMAAAPRALAAGGKDPKALLTLCAAGDIMPVEPGRAPVDVLNRILCARVDGPEEIGWLALPCGTAVAVDRGLLRVLRDGKEIDEVRFPGWAGFLASHGL